MSGSKYDKIRDEEQTQEARRDEGFRSEILQDPDKTDALGSQDERRREGDHRHEHRGDRGERWREQDHQDDEDHLRAEKRNAKFAREDDPEDYDEDEGVVDGLRPVEP